MIATARIAAATRDHSSVFARLRQFAPHHLNHGSLGPYESFSQTESRSVQPICTARRYAQQTDRQRTDHGTCNIYNVGLHRELLAVLAMRAINTTPRGRKKEPLFFYE